MATHSDDESFGAPENFHITTENDDDGSHWSGCQIKCPLCNYSRKYFSCHKCISKGNFVHSSHHLAERFVEKQMKYENLKSVHRAQQTACLHLLHKRKLAEDLQFAIKQKKENILLLKKLISERSSGTKTLTEKCETIRLENAKVRKQIPQYVKTCQQFGDYIEKTEERNAKKVAERTKLFEELKQCRIQNIQKLIKFIFPLSQRISKGETSTAISTNTSSKSSPVEYNVTNIDARKNVNDMNAADSGTIVSAETLNALAEATHTTYIRGRWVQDSHGELQHVIIEPSLPDNGDYSAYNDWVATTIKDGVPNPPGASEAMTSSNAAYRISAALTYTTQLVHLLSYYLDVRLPFRINYSDFCKKELNEQSFSRKVARLNTNILYLCYTQHVKLNTLWPNHTLENISMLLNLDISDLGRIGPVDVNNGFIGKQNIQLMQNLNAGNTDSGSDDEDDGALPTEWEAVSHPHHHPPDLALPSISQNPQQTASVAGGFVSSAVQSIWRVLTTGK
ncbi:beclin 1-associated autophagy-related key regulator [Contarinia nasturtii]|uniref:beclin 1-associated autophagy-related key regulator n=1 Tax=Contarinia nasturtii TaxID=265458 RepID=UPI0012D46C91|nr:beclin 1-associated autophagy-related key regulator [Contarinia nasturtii]